MNLQIIHFLKSTNHVVLESKLRKRNNLEYDSDIQLSQAYDMCRLTKFQRGTVVLKSVFTLFVCYNEVGNGLKLFVNVSYCIQLNNGKEK